MTDRQLLQQALDALWNVNDHQAQYKAEIALIERLAHCDRCGKRLGGEGDIHTCSPKQEPVGMRWRWPGYAWVYTEEIRSDLAGNPEKELLYTTPPAAQRQWVGLTKYEEAECWYGENCFEQKPPFDGYAEAIEAKLKEKNT